VISQIFKLQARLPPGSILVWKVPHDGDEYPVEDRKVAIALMEWLDRGPLFICVGPGDG
jgi:hypothetical protein